MNNFRLPKAVRLPTVSNWMMKMRRHRHFFVHAGTHTHTQKKNYSASLTVSIEGRVHVFCVKWGESPSQCLTAAKEPHLFTHSAFSRSLSSSLSTALSRRSSRSGKPTRIKPSDTHCAKRWESCESFHLGDERDGDGWREWKERGRRVGESDRLCARRKRCEPTSLYILMYTCSVLRHTHTRFAIPVRTFHWHNDWYSLPETKPNLVI